MPNQKCDAKTRSYSVGGVDSEVDNRMFVSSGADFTQHVTTICVMATILDFIQQIFSTAMYLSDVSFNK